MSTKTLTRAVKGPSSDDRPEWLKRRRFGITATEVAKVASGRAADVRAILVEKINDKDTPNLAGNKFIDWGHEREPIIAALVLDNFGIEPNKHLFAHGDNDRYLATPDGHVDDEFTGERLISEIKTSKHDLAPFPAGHAALQSAVPVLTVEIANSGLSTYFWSTGYYDQMQWQMYVMGATRCLFAPEQHNDKWPHPTPLGVKFVWVERNEERIKLLKARADAFLVEIDAATPADIAPASTMDPDLAIEVHGYLKGLADEKVGAALKKKHWDAALKMLVETPDFTTDNEEAKVTWASSRVAESVIDLREATTAQLAQIERAEATLKAAEARATAADAKVAAARERLTKARARFVSERVVTGDRRLTITAKKSK